MVENNIDYKKLLEICMFEWLNAEGCCWSGEDFDGKDFDGEKIYDKLSREEENAVKELFDKCYKRHIAKNQ